MPREHRDHRYRIALIILTVALVVIGGIACGSAQQSGTAASITPVDSQASATETSGSHAVTVSPFASPIAVGTAVGSTPPPWAPQSGNPEIGSPQVPPEPGHGRPAISPRLGRQAGQPAFTEQDVRAYLEAHPPSLADSSKSAPTITKIEFLTEKEAENQLQTSIDGHADGDLVCIVTLYGDFNLSISNVPNVPILPDSPTETGHVAQLVFDANTGNLLIEGIDSLN
jgi:hypothetical protein